MLIPNITVSRITLVNHYVGTKESFDSISRDVHLFGYQFTGHYAHTFGKRKIDLKANTLFFINAKDSYKVKTKEIGNSICFAFDCVEDLDLESFAVDCSGETKLATLFEKAYINWNRHSEQHRSIAFADLYNAIVQVNRFYDRKYVSSDVRERLDTVVSYIFSNIHTNITLPQLAEVVGISDRRLRTMFQEYYHMSPQQYIMSQRMQLACRYIKTDLYTLQEVADMVGFTDIYYFNRCFKKHIGASPRQYKKIRWQEGQEGE